MYDATQIQSRRNRRDASIVGNYKGKPVYRCHYCRENKFNKEKLEEHVIKCKELDRGIENIDYVICEFCGLYGKSLGVHVVNIHGISLDEYLKNYGKLVCEKSLKQYSKSGKINGSWVARAKADGYDLTEYRKKLSVSIKKSILANPEERKRRAAVMTAVNKTDVMRRKASETAIKTSARKDIQESRALQLKKWRDNHPDEFYEKCVSRFISAWQSKPEKELFSIVSILDDYDFCRGQVVKSDKFINKSSRKQIDIADKLARVYIEYDGYLHFADPFKTKGRLEYTIEQDRLLDEHIIKHNWTLIRVGYDQYSGRKGFVKECLDELYLILLDPKPGVYKIGSVYVKN